MEWMIRAAIVAGQLVFGFAGAYALIRLLPQRRPRWTHLLPPDWQQRRMSERALRTLRLSRDQSAFAERETLLAGCGIAADAAWYMAARRVLLIVLPLALAGLLTYRVLHGTGSWLPSAVPSALFIALYGDVPWLRSVRKLRAQRITKEVFVMSNQLLYLAESSLHIHAKLFRCVPYTRTLRGDLERLLAEWYHDAEKALYRFKHRIGTDDGMSFAETIDSLRLDESAEYYELLRERIQDYKEKLELAKESRKETASYALFMLAGIPILYTFQVFIYPWVQEGQKLFDTLG
ncbi:hypothetical protein GOM71_22345 [Paenibacillus sp. NEAU-GSW1]|nr:hypothetical protein [Paenibacillus sp. NEAU-GSW1]